MNTQMSPKAATVINERWDRIKNEAVSIVQHLEWTLRMQYVSRWTICAVHRPQSVAEHSFNVWLIARGLYKALEGGTGHNSDEMRSLHLWALLHDAEEVLTGDIPSSFKSTPELAEARAAIETGKEKVIQKEIPAIAGMHSGVKGTVVEAIVRMADGIEALRYYRVHGARTPQYESVVNHIHGKIISSMNDARKAFGSHTGWDTVTEVVYRLLDEPL